MPEYFGKSNAFLHIPIGISRNKRLLKHPKAILLAGEVISMLNVTGEFYASNAELARRLAVTPRTIQDYFVLLEEEGLLLRSSEYDGGKRGTLRKIRAGEKLADAFAQGWKTPSHAHETDCTPPRNTARPPHETDCTPPRNVFRPNITVNNSSKEKHTNKHSVSKAERERLLTDKFEKLWANYPKKQGKKNALRHYIAWKKASSDHTDEFLAKKMEEYKQYIAINHVATRYIKNGDTWFNGGFEDDYGISNSQNSDQTNYGYDGYA